MDLPVNGDKGIDKGLGKNKILGPALVCFLSFLCFSTVPPSSGRAWHDHTHLAISKAAGYAHWYNSVGADMAKLKAGEREAHNHYCSIPRYRKITPRMVLAQVRYYDTVDPRGHLYGAILASLRDFIREKKKGKYAQYHLAYCAHYVGDLSQPLHNTIYSDFNRENHWAFDAVLEDEVLQNLHKIKIYPIQITSERDLAEEIARIANISKELGYRLENENRIITKAQAYRQISHSASLLKAILAWLRPFRRP